MTKKVHFEMTPIDASKACDTSLAAEVCPECQAAEKLAWAVFSEAGEKRGGLTSMPTKCEKHRAPPAPEQKPTCPECKHEASTAKKGLCNIWACCCPCFKFGAFGFPAAPPPEQAREMAEKKAGLVVSQWIATPERHYADLIAAVRDAILSAGVAAPEEK